MTGDDVFQFEGFTLDLRRGALRKGQEQIELRPKSFSLLCYLVAHAGRLVPKDELIRAIWPDVTATDESLTRCVSDVRLALQDQGQRIIRTVPRRGYLFDAAVSRGADAAMPQPAGTRARAETGIGLTPPAPPLAAPDPAPSAGGGVATAGPAGGASDGTAPEPPRPERRQLTVLSCELDGLAALSTRLDPEDLQEVTAACHRRCAEIVERHMGHVAHYGGDGILAYFGYAQANEYDAERAVRAGLELAAALPALALPRLAPGADVSLAARIGVATGMVVIGDRAANGAGAEQAVIGATPNLAARLQALADPGAVVITAETRSLTGGLFDYRDLGAVALPGFAAAVPAWQVLGESDAESRFEALRATTTPLVGREEEVGLLQRRWQQARAGEGGVVLLSGEPGIGKSRIAESLIAQLAGQPHTLLRWLCTPHHQDSALFPAITQLERAAGFQREDSAAQRLDKLEALLATASDDPRGAAPLLADLLSVPADGRYPASDLTPQKRKEKTQQALLAMVEGLAARRPLLMLCEDVHWIDPTTREVLDLLVDRVPALRILLVVTFRPEFKAPWIGLPQVTLLSLSRLPPRRRVEMIGHLTRGKMLPADIVDQISSRTDGVPLFIEELTKAVVESDLLVESGGQYVATAATAPQAIPASLQESLLARLDRLASTRAVAQTAAALGRTFTHETVSAVATMPQAELETALAQLVHAELIYRRGSPPHAEYSFKHALVQEAAYGTMLRSQRQDLHAHIAAILAERFPEMRESDPETLAYHFTQGGRIAEAVPLWAAAGQHAASRTAHAEAAAHLQTALELLRQLPEDPARAGTELQLLIGLVVSLGASRGYASPEAGRALAEARAICDAMGNVAELYAVYHGIWAFLLIAGDLDGAEDMARRCMAIGEETGLAEQRIEGEGALGYILFAKGDLAAARRHLEHAAALYASHDGARLPMLGTQDSLVHILSSLLMVLLATGDDDGAIRVVNDLARHARALGRPFDLAFGLSWLAFYELLRGSYPQALSIAEEALAICREHGYPLYELVTASLRAHALGHLGKAEQVLPVAQSAIPAFQGLGMMHFTCFYEGEVAGLQLNLGDVAAARHSIDAAIAAAHRHGDRYFLPALHRRRAEILARDPDAGPDQVAAALDEAIAIAEAQGAAGFARRAAALRRPAPAAG